jgi:hypothetical protein
MTFEWWPAIVFGWPGPIVAICLSVIGVVAGKRGWLVAAAIALLPFALYLRANPRTRWLFLLPLVPFFGAIAIARRSFLLAWLSVLVLSALVTWVGTGHLRCHSLNLVHLEAA